MLKSVYSASAVALGLVTLAACGGETVETPAAPEPTEPTIIEAPVEVVEVPSFDAGDYVVSWRARPLVDGELTSVSDDGVVVTARGVNPPVGPAEAFPVTPGVSYKVDVSYEILSIEGEPVADIIGWSIDDEGELVSDNAFAAAFRPGSSQAPGEYTISALFTFDAPTEEGVLQIPEAETASSIRFTTNPVRGGNGSTAKISSITVTPLTN
ncbi:MAG: hypothetical protein AAFQ22_15950 [Pseudomonadota bacterium]